MYVNISEKDHKQRIHFKIKCKDCGRMLQVLNMQRKELYPYLDFCVLTTYCKKCDLTIIEFKTIPKKIRKRI